jgi:hypothetical protein
MTEKRVPVHYSDEIAEEICARVIAGEFVSHICRDDHMPDVTTIWRWCREKPEFREQMDTAKELQADRIFEEMLEISDGVLPDGASGDNRKDWDQVQRAKLQIDTRKFVVAKLLPRRYGDRQVIEQKSEITVTTPEYTDEDLAKALSQFMSEVEAGKAAKPLASGCDTSTVP